MCVFVLCFSEASKHLVDEMKSVSPSELEDVIEKVLDAVEKQPCRWCIMCLSDTFATFVGCMCTMFVYNCECLGIYELSLCFSNSVVKHDRPLCGGKRCAGLQSVLRWNHVSVIVKLFRN